MLEHAGIRPFLKWAGNKYRVLKHILPLLPEGERLIEPFAGSAAVYLNTHYSAALLGDVNPDLVHLYQSLQQERGDFIRYCQTLFTPDSNQADVYYKLRVEFNQAASGKRRNALFLYLNRHGYNGLCRYNAKGIYNVPFGRYKKPYFPENEMKYFADHSATAQYMVADFYTLMEQAGKGDVVYCDPPYVPLTATANFTSYAKNRFGLAELEALVMQARKAAKRGAFVMLSNHDTPHVRQLVEGANITDFEVQRYISRDGHNRIKAKELLAVFT